MCVRFNRSLLQCMRNNDNLFLRPNWIELDCVCPKQTDIPKSILQTYRRRTSTWSLIYYYYTYEAAEIMIEREVCVDDPSGVYHTKRTHNIYDCRHTCVSFMQKRRPWWRRAVVYYIILSNRRFTGRMLYRNIVQIWSCRFDAIPTICR